MAKILTMAPPRRPYIVVVEYEASNVAFVAKIAPLVGRSGLVDHHYFKHFADLVNALQALGISQTMLAGTGSALAQRGRCIFDNVLLDTRKVEHLKNNKGEPLAALD